MRGRVEEKVGGGETAAVSVDFPWEGKIRETRAPCGHTIVVYE